MARFYSSFSFFFFHFLNRYKKKGLFKKVMKVKRFKLRLSARDKVIVSQLQFAKNFIFRCQSASLSVRFAVSPQSEIAVSRASPVDIGGLLW